jgi:acyl-CoA-binding protein
MSGEQASNVTNVPGVLKAFVIVSGIMLLIGAILLALLIMFKAADDGNGTESLAPKVPVDLALPTGAKIKQMEIDGKRLVLLAQDDAGQQYVAVVDALSGERLSLIRVTPSP